MTMLTPPIRIDGDERDLAAAIYAGMQRGEAFIPGNPPSLRTLMQRDGFAESRLHDDGWLIFRLTPAGLRTLLGVEGSPS